MNALTWNCRQTSPELIAALELLGSEYPISEGEQPNLSFTRTQTPGITCSDGIYQIDWSSISGALRGVGQALAELEASSDRCDFKTFGIMVDCSRNAVMTVDYAKSMLRRLALMGYNQVMLYTEDTYELDSEPAFGILRGAYSAAEIRELDGYAAVLGIELCGCIQTLGHLEVFLRSCGGAEYRDTPGILLVDDEKTYYLIRQMLRFWAENCRSRRIHIGMDEAHDLGRGKFLDRNGYQSNFEIFNRHLSKVSAICAEFGFEPMLWSDMYFRMGSKTHDYYDLDADIPADVRAAIPAASKLVYWDYYHLDCEFYDKMIELHRGLGKEPVMGSGLWTWYRLFYDHGRSVERVLPCLESCRKNQLEEFFFTLWGDNGAYCNFPTVYSGLLWGAELAHGQPADDERLERLSRALKLPSYRETMLASSMNVELPNRENGVGTLSVVLWDDPLLKKGWRSLGLDREALRTDFTGRLDAALSGLPPESYFHQTGTLLLTKVRLTAELESAYRNGDAAGLRKIREHDIPALIALYDEFQRGFREQWRSCYKLNGLETIQVRLGGLCARYRELALRLEEFELGVLPDIPELLPGSGNPRRNPLAERYSDLAFSGCF